jgi:hypothetical protein
MPTKDQLQGLVDLWRTRALGLRSAMGRHDGQLLGESEGLDRAADQLAAALATPDDDRRLREQVHGHSANRLAALATPDTLPPAVPKLQVGDRLRLKGEHYSVRIQTSGHAEEWQRDTRRVVAVERDGIVVWSDTLPPVAVGDWVSDIEDPKPYLVKYELVAAELNTPRLARYISEVRGHRNGVAFRWQRGKE